MTRGAEQKAFPLSPYGGEGTTPSGGWERAGCGAASGDNATPALTPTLSHYWERGTTSVYFLALIFLIGLAAIFFLFSQNKPCANFNEATLQAPSQIITIALANTREKQSKGLGGCTYVPEDSGMYFLFDEQDIRRFWMKDMIIPIDIIWLIDGRVVGIEKNVPNFPLDTPDEELPRYTSSVPVDAVLEVGAGKAEEYGIKEGSEITLKL